MLRGFENGASAMNVIARQQEMISGNLANLQTNGHRRAVMSFQQRMADSTTASEGYADLGTQVAVESIDFSQGNVQNTERSLDVALFGDGFFAVQGPENQTWFTRGGSFQRSGAGELQTPEGFPVLGTGGPIVIPPGISEREITISPEGLISAQGQELGTLRIVSFADNRQLIPQGQSFFEAPANLAETQSSATLMQGSRELSNGHPVTELVGLIVNSRLYEAAQRSIRTLSDAIQQHYR